MFAVIRTGGKQYKVARDQIIEVEKLEGAAGSTVEFDQVLAVGDADARTIGTPTVAGAGVRATIVTQKQDDKVIVFKKKRRQNYRRKHGHRQELTAIRITEVVSEGFVKGAAAKAGKSVDRETATEPKPKVRSGREKTPATKKQTGTKAAARKGASDPAAEDTTAVKKPAAQTRSEPKGEE
jgi:large subunit ribosomal protein L21